MEFISQWKFPIFPRLGRYINLCKKPVIIKTSFSFMLESTRDVIMLLHIKYTVKININCSLWNTAYDNDNIRAEIILIYK